ncbi:hypothetical protein OAG71_02850, partial [bacterium]|nr:hypothetical protein [bacterium]
MVVADLPRVGLGNMLLVWANAICLAKQHDLRLHVFGWNQFRIGPWLRGESRKRNYNAYFKRIPSSPLDYWKAWLNFKIMKRECVHQESPLAYTENLTASFLAKNKYRIFRVSEVPPPPDYFVGLHNDRDYIRDQLFKSLNQNIRKKLDSSAEPEIAVHVRRGDFIRESDPRYRHNGNTEKGWENCVTPLSFFIEAIEKIRYCTS